MNEEPVQETDELRELREKAAKADEYLDLARRQKAELLNYQERVRREREDRKRQALDDFVRDFLDYKSTFSCNWALRVIHFLLQKLIANRTMGVR